MKGPDLIKPELIEGLQPRDVEEKAKEEPLVVKISRNLFLDAQFSSNKL